MKPPKLLREWNGLRVRLIGREIETKGGAVAKRGAVGKIRTSGHKASFRVDACEHCHLSFVVLGIAKDELPLLFEILPSDHDDFCNCEHCR